MKHRGNMPNVGDKNHHTLKNGRSKLLEQINTLTDKPMIILSFVWLGLLIFDFIRGLNEPLQILNYTIWALFVLDFLIEITIAPNKLHYLRKNWLTASSLVIPALRVFRIFQIIRFLRAGHIARTLGLLRLLTSLNRTVYTVAHIMGRHGVGYLIALTTIITFASAAAMVRFESPDALREAGFVKFAEAGSGLHNYGDALWWTAMIMTTMGSEYWPKTAEGRFLGWLLSLYAFAIFGYITATIASYFIGQDKGKMTPDDGKESTDAAAIQVLREEIAALRKHMETLLLYDHESSSKLNDTPDKKGNNG